MLAMVLRIAARLALQLKDKAFAAEAFQLYLEKVDGSDVEALCGLVQALATVAPERAEQYAQRLQVPEYGQFDAEELEMGGIPRVTANQPKRSVEGADADKAAQKAETKKKTKPRFPKGFDLANPGPPPGPERWLPKRERAEFKKKMRKRDKNLARGPQGAMVVDDNAFRKQGPSTAQVEVSKDGTTGSRNNQRRKQQQGRKK